MLKRDVLTFQEAIEESGSAIRNLLLGNGFSIACHPMFSYDSLFSQVTQNMQTTMPELNSLFVESGIKDFETMIGMLRYSLEK